jgi:hypothetical protein
MGNLLKKVGRIEIEHRFPDSSFIHDLALYDKSDVPFAAIEVIYTHPPDDRVVQHLKQHEILLMCYRLSICEDVRDYGNALKPFDVDLCTKACVNPESQEHDRDIAWEASVQYGRELNYNEGDYKTDVPCPTCGNLKTKTDMVIHTLTCYTCSRPMRVAFLDDATGVYRVPFGHHTPPRFFNSHQRRLAETNGVCLRSRLDSEGRSTLLNACSNCQEYYEDMSLAKNVWSYHRGLLKHSTQIAAGMRCHICESSENH